MEKSNRDWYLTDNHYAHEKKRIKYKSERFPWVQYDEVTDTTGPSFFMDETITVNVKWSDNA